MLTTFKFLTTLLFTLVAFSSHSSAEEDTPTEQGRAAVEFTANTEFNIAYEAEGATRVALWLSTDGGKTWALYGYDDDAVPPIGFRAEKDGSYGLIITTEDEAGNQTPEPKNGDTAQMTVVVDRRPPELELFTGPNNFYGATQPLSLRWKAFDEYLATNSVELSYSIDNAATWVALKQDAPRTGAADWNPMQVLENNDDGGIAPNVLFKISARDKSGNIGEYITLKPVLADFMPPSVIATGPEGETASRVEITYTTEEGENGSDLDYVELFVTNDEGATWEKMPLIQNNTRPLIWQAPRSGRWGLYLAGVDLAGNKALAPELGATPQINVEINTTVDIELLAFKDGGTFKGGSTHLVKWQSESDNTENIKTALELSVDNGLSWNSVATELPIKGEHTLLLPKEDAAKVLLRVNANKDGAVIASAVSNVFAIKSTPPQVTLSITPVTSGEIANKVVAAPPKYRLPKARATSQDRFSDIKKAEQALNAMRYSEAIKYAQAALQKNAAVALANTILGSAIARETDLSMRKGLDPTEALRLYDRALGAFVSAATDEPRSQRAYFWMGVVRYKVARIYHDKLSRFDEANKYIARSASDFDRSLSMEPNSSDEYYYAAVAYYMLSLSAPKHSRPRHEARTIKLFVKSLERARSSTLGRANYYLAIISNKNGDKLLAKQYAEEALKHLSPKSPHAAQMQKLVK